MSSAYDRTTKIWNTNGTCIFNTGNSPSHLVRDGAWVNNSLALGTENIFQDHHGVVNYDPTYLDSKFKLIIGSSNTVNSVDYSLLHGSLAFSDDLGRVVLLSLQNARKQLNMSRKGYATASVFQTEILGQKQAGEYIYSVSFEDHNDLSHICAPSRAPAFDPKKNRNIGTTLKL